tara:strand:+ start:389 stop:1315 length:927 start_codon:yes stop_codon:yes gene_type:complete
MDKIGICGGGLIGASWALGFSSNKYKVFVYDNNKKVRDKFLEILKSLYEDLSIIKNISFDEIESNIIICDTIEEICTDSTLIQESIIEDLKLKKAIFIELEKFSNKETILASSSSYLLPSKISSQIIHKNRCIVAHPALPPHVVPFVEICPSEKTSDVTIQKAKKIYKSAEYIPIVLKKEIEGFVLNRLQGALLNEAVRLHEEGYASIEDIDVSLKHALGIRWAFLGPFEIMDLNAPGGIKDSFTRYRPGIKNLAEQQNSIPDYSDNYILKLEKEQRLRLKSSDRDNRIKKRNKLIALVRKLKLENGE